LSTIKIQEEEKPIPVLSSHRGDRSVKDQSAVQEAVSVNSSVMFESELGEAGADLIVSRRTDPAPSSRIN
jgi:hypothetical protein